MYRLPVLEQIRGQICHATPDFDSTRMLIGLVRETLLFQDFLDDLCNSIDRCVTLIQDEQAWPQMALQYWTTAVSSLVEERVLVPWLYIEDELEIIEHAGLSVYTANWRTRLVSESANIEKSIASCHDFLDFENVVESASQLRDLCRAFDFTVRTHIRELMESLIGEMTGAAR